MDARCERLLSKGRKKFQREKEVADMLINHIIVGEKKNYKVILYKPFCKALNTHNSIEKLLESGFSKEDLLNHDFSEYDINEVINSMGMEKK